MAGGVTLHISLAHKLSLRHPFPTCLKASANYGYIICEANAVGTNNSKCPCAMSTPLTGIIASEHVDGHVRRGHVDSWAITISDFLEN